MKKGYIYSIISAILFGAAGLFVKLILKTGLDSISLLTVQYIIAVLLMFVVAFIKEKEKLHVTKKQLFNLAILGIVGNTFMTIFYYKAFEYLPVAVVTMLLFTYPIMVLIYSAIFEKRKLGRKKVLIMFLAFLGCLLTLNILSGGFKYSAVGIVFGLLSAVFYAFMNLYTEKKLEGIDSLSINAYSTLFSLISLLLYKWPYFLFEGNIKIESFIYIVILAVVCEIIPLTLLYSAIKYIGSLKVSIISNLEIPTAMIVSFFVLKEHVYLTQIIGAGLIVYAIYLIRKDEK
ncbi:EamA family transporter [Clostridium sp. P21]|uniref:EamA family transporter n=1 Tax=Clostridium muellerianum TaxID=2716538 RepID=A0A7Y0EJ78_9CLOT|nr:DMT family transporter [Clostridium muellerianum]NMM64481.1 EamA family transporter [Clostridium muellerianum]